MEGHLLCNGVFCLGSLFHAATQSLHRGRPGQNMKDHPLSHGARQADWWMGWGKSGREIKKTIWSMRDRSKRGGWGVMGGSAEGKDGEWFVRLVSKTSCDKSSRVVSQNGVCVFDCVAIVSLREAAGQTRPRQEEDTSGQSELLWRPTQVRTWRCSSVSELDRLKRNSHSTGWKFNPRGQRLEREKPEWKQGATQTGGSSQDNQREEVRQSGGGRHTQHGWNRDGRTQKWGKHNGRDQRGLQNKSK